MANARIPCRGPASRARGTPRASAALRCRNRCGGRSPSLSLVGDAARAVVDLAVVGDPPAILMARRLCAGRGGVLDCQAPVTDAGGIPVVENLDAGAVRTSCASASVIAASSDSSLLPLVPGFYIRSPLLRPRSPGGSSAASVRRLETSASSNGALPLRRTAAASLLISFAVAFVRRPRVLARAAVPRQTALFVIDAPGMRPDALLDDFLAGTSSAGVR